ncbi:hypothetical protein [Dapis sp. BLCC M172]|uniref:hypothetical protein n=1 Tax=Dapis sp. BLCC M172 TaxID=2975281 RepID=UPI003CFAD197
MVMVTFHGCDSIQYNSDFLTEEIINGWLSLDVSEILEPFQQSEANVPADRGSEEIDLFSLPIIAVMNSRDFKEKNVQAFYDEDITRSAVQQAIEMAQQDEDLEKLYQKGGRSWQEVEDKVLSELRKELQTKEINENVYKANSEFLQRIEYSTNQEGLFECRIDGELFVRANSLTSEGKTVEIVTQIACVIIDIAFIIMSIVGVGNAAGVQPAKTIAKVAEAITNKAIKIFKGIFKEIGAKFVVLIDKIKRLIGTATSEGSRLWNAVKESAREIYAVICSLIKAVKASESLYAFTKLMLKTFKILIWDQNPFLLLIYVVQALATIIADVLTDGAALVIQVIQLVNSLMFFIIDVVKLVLLLLPNVAARPSIPAILSLVLTEV